MKFEAYANFPIVWDNWILYIAIDTDVAYYWDWAGYQVLTWQAWATWATWAQWPWTTTWWDSISWTSWTWLTITKQSWALDNLLLQTDHNWTATLNLTQNAIWDSDTFAQMLFKRKTFNWVSIRPVAFIEPYTTDASTAANLKWWIRFWIYNWWSGSFALWINHEKILCIWDYVWTTWWSSWLYFASWTPITSSLWSSSWFLYNNSWTLTWVNEWADPAMHIPLPNSAASWVWWYSITFWNTQTNALYWYKIDTWTSLLDHNSLYLTWTRHSVYIWNADQAPWTTANKLYAVWWNLYWNWTQLN